MPDIRKTGSILIRSCWVGLMAWQLAWHALIPEPHGSQNWALGLIAVLPLIPLTAGTWRHHQKTLAWGMFLAMLYFIVGIMEAWSNPPQRLAALVQVALTCGYFAGLVLLNRPAKPQA